MARIDPKRIEEWKWIADTAARNATETRREEPIPNGNGAVRCTKGGVLRSARVDEHTIRRVPIISLRSRHEHRATLSADWDN